LDILYLCHRIPYPPDKGDKIRSHAVLKHLAKHHCVHVGCFVDDPADMAYAEDVRRLAGGECLFIRLTPASKILSAAWAIASGQSVTTAYFSSRAMTEWIKALQSKRAIDRTVVFCSAVAPYVLDNPSLDVDRSVLDLVDIDSDKWRQYAADRRGLRRWLYEREAEKIFVLERTAARRFGATLLASQHEAETFAAMVPESASRIFGLANGVDRQYFTPGDLRNPFSAGENPIVMTGRMDYRPNVEGAKWFLDEILPLVLEHVPRARFYVVGANPPAFLRALSGGNFVVAGRVDDIRPYIQHASAIVAPLRIARGVQNKVLEAMAMEKPVVATRAASRSLMVKSEIHLWIKDDPFEFAQAVVSAVQGKDRLEIAGRARDYVERHHDWARNLSPLDCLLAEGLAAGPKAELPRRLVEALP
jgi:sugar transferase (PEP-CTERM/EpsH1 system associated)